MSSESDGKKLGIGIIGLGMASAPHARSLLDLSDRVEVIAAYSPTPTRRQSFAETYGLPVTDEIETIFADPRINAILILTPPNTHLELVQRAATARKHVLLEKPLDITPERAKALVETARDTGIRLGIVFQNRFRPAALALKDILGEGRLGRIVSTSMRLSNWRPQGYYDEPGRGTLARDGGGVLLTQAIHTIDLMVSLAGLPREVFAQAVTSPLHRMETEDLVAGTLIFGNGAIGTISATTCAYPGFPERIEIIGTLGTAVLEGDTMRAAFLDGTSAHAGHADGGTGTGADPMAFSHHLHRALISDFVEAIEEERSPIVTGEDALNAHRLIEALLQSSATDLPQKVG
ncbi:MAG: Gfo/Idh/MocA family oxidoreductase [Rhizobiaceae bacterium]|nr:Gfo/Idh/MocA family oxidoreductase [Rhizobiaceae bacterium]